ncbi:MAG: TauD/TfdA family dioxygenase [Alphaproteobacteria bacterium]|jgi:taurine dioxygenase|nr:TauD/TfdA family dioxygenase [Alphaproteobacteria bacterium]
MTLGIKRIAKTFVGEVGDFDIADDHDAATIAEVRQALIEHSMLVFHGQSLTNEEHIRFSRKFGPPEIHTVSQYLLPDHPEIIALANRGENGTKPIANGGAYWHADITYKAKPPMGSVLYSLEIPPDGGDTLFCDLYAAYDALPDETKDRIADLKAVHSYHQRFLKSRAIDDGYKKDSFELSPEQLAEIPEVEHPIVRTHPESGRQTLYVNEGFVTQVVGMDEEESEALLLDLFQHSTRDEFVYRHEWQVGDVIFWDNRCTMHCATEYDTSHARRMHRTTIQGDAPY